MAVSRLPPHRVRVGARRRLRLARVLVFLAGVLVAAGLQAALFLLWDSGDPRPAAPKPAHVTVRAV